MQPSTALAFFALASSALANPLKTKLRPRDPNTFELFAVHQHSSSNCLPVGCVPVDVYSAHDCNGGGCGSQGVGAPYDDSWCDVDLQVCDRTVKLVSKGDGDCKRAFNLKSDMNGQPYATIMEGDEVVGSCSVDFTQYYNEQCGTMHAEGQSKVYCHFDK
ncbi:hypothetical protein N0V90_003416 [Kalmusia sp. IMI 367209]|nr:hypothetical protein N0V90_003416 [Kalmusia sp. IMI 367209]